MHRPIAPRNAPEELTLDRVAECIRHVQCLTVVRILNSIYEGDSSKLMVVYGNFLTEIVYTNRNWDAIRPDFEWSSTAWNEQMGIEDGENH